MPLVRAGKITVSAVLAFALGFLSLGLGASAADQRAVLTLYVNTVAHGDVNVVVRGDDVLARVSDLKAAGISDLHGGAVSTVRNEQYVSLKSLAPAVTYSVDQEAFALKLAVGGALLPGNGRISLRSDDFATSFHSQPSAFLNYAVQENRSQLAFANQIGISRGTHLFSAFVSRDFTGTFTVGPVVLINDDFAHSQRTEIGQFSTSTGILGGYSNLMGFRINRAFQLNPGLLRTSSNSIDGSVSTPAVADIYVNGQLVRQEQLAPGQFSLADLPLAQGPNSERIVIRDAFGQTQVLDRSFYYSTQLLRKGLTDYDFGVGVENLGLGVRRGTALVSGRYSRGFTDTATGGGRIEAGRGFISGGPELTAATKIGQFTLDAAVSRDQGYSGSAASLQYSLNQRRFNIGLREQIQTPWYATISLPALTDRAVASTDAFVGFLSGGSSEIRLNYSATHMRDTGSQSVFTLGLNKQLSQFGNLMVQVGRQNDGKGGSFTALVGITRRFGNNLNAGVQSQLQNGSVETAMSVNRTPNSRTGLSYNLNATTGTTGTDSNVLMTYRGNYGVAEIESNQGQGFSGDTTLRYSGGLAFVGGHSYLTQPVTGSFAVVDVAGVPNVRAYANNMEIGRTDRSGRILVTDLLPYQKNEITINPDDAPPNVIIGESQHFIAPTQNSGAVVSFDLHTFQAAVGKLVVLRKGALEVPAFGQVTVHLGSKDATSEIGADGAFFLENVTPGSHPAQIDYAKGTCAFTLDVPASASTYVKIGTVQCAIKS